MPARKGKENMKKRSKKVLAFGVAALMALSSLPASILTATAAIGANQTANGGTSYNFVLKDMATDSNTVEVSSDDVAAGNVTRRIGVYIDSEEWARDAFIQMVSLNWTATTGATLENGGKENTSLYFENILDVSQKNSKSETIAMPDGGTLKTAYPMYCLAKVLGAGGKYKYPDPYALVTTRQIAVDKVFGSAIMDNGANKVKFTYAYYASQADKDAKNRSSKTQECDVQTNENGVPYITYDYVSQDDFSTKTATVELPYYSVNHFVDTQAGKAVPDANNFYLWQYKGIQNDTSGTSFTFGDSMAKTFTEFDVVIPQGTPDGTYYVQLCSRSPEDGSIEALSTAADFNSLKERQQAMGTKLEDRSTFIGCSS